MCGIFGATSFAPLQKREKEIIKILGESEDRGKDAFGIFAYNPSGKPVYEKDEVIIPEQLWKRVGKVSDFLNSSGKIHLTNVESFLGHTRQATTGTHKDMKNNHPFESADFVWAHNGMISNYDHLKKKHDLEYESECDSYVIGALAQKFLSGGKSVEESLKLALDELSGSFAVWIVHKPTKRLFLAKNIGRPLDYSIVDNNGVPAIVFASLGAYITKHFAGTKVQEVPDSDLIEVLVDKKDAKLSNLGTFLSSGGAGPKGRMGLPVSGGQTQTTNERFMGFNSRDNRHKSHQSNAINQLQWLASKLHLNGEFYHTHDHGATLITSDSNFIATINNTTFGSRLHVLGNSDRYMINIKPGDMKDFCKEVEAEFGNIPSEDKYQAFFMDLAGLEFEEVHDSLLTIRVSSGETARYLEKCNVHLMKEADCVFFNVRGKEKKRLKHLAKIRKTLIEKVQTNMDI